LTHLVAIDAGYTAVYLASVAERMAALCWHATYCCCATMLPLVLQELKAQGVQFIVAPYEADAQMAYLARRNDVQLVITEDSDLLAYGCPRCGNLAGVLRFQVEVDVVSPLRQTAVWYVT
jgi:hypothetical protein